MLTFIVPTIPGRESLLSRCLHSMTDQAAGHAVEILVVEGTAGLGAKVNLAVREANGSHVSIVDDDDYLTGSFLDSVGRLDVDYVGFKIAELTDGRWSKSCAHSGESKSWDGPFRWPVPKGVTRTEIARAVTFGDHYTADRDWSRQVCELVVSWRFVDRHLYVYDSWPNASAFIGDRPTRDVGWWPFDESLVRRIRLDADRKAA